MFWKYAANLQGNTRAEVWFGLICFATLPKSNFGMSVLSIFIEITLRYGCSPVNLLHFFRTTFPKNTSSWLILICLVDMFSYTTRWGFLKCFVLTFCIEFLAPIKTFNFFCLGIIISFHTLSCSWIVKLMKCRKIFLLTVQ